MDPDTQHPSARGGDAMNQTSGITWDEANQAELVSASLAAIRDALEQGLLRRRGARGPRARDGTRSRMAPAQPPALEVLCTRIRPLRLRAQVLLMCAGAEMDSRFAAIYAAAQGTRQVLPTFGLALSAFEAPTGAPSRRPAAATMAAGGAGRGGNLTTGPLRISERILHYLAGMACLDERLEAVVRPVVEAGPPSRSQRAACERIAAAWSRADGLPMMPAVQLTGTAWGEAGRSRRGVRAAGLEPARGLRLAAAAGPRRDRGVPEALGPRGRAQLERPPAGVRRPRRRGAGPRPRSRG